MDADAADRGGDSHDGDGDGKIKKEELREALKMVGLKVDTWGTDELDDIFESTDTNHDNVVDFGEFRVLFNKFLANSAEGYKYLAQTMPKEEGKYDKPADKDVKDPIEPLRKRLELWLLEESNDDTTLHLNVMTSLFIFLFL